MDKKTFHFRETFELEAGGYLPELHIAFHTYGKLTANQDNVVWICHALTANSDPVEWWPGLVGPGKYLDPADYYIVCANLLGSCYGTTGPLSINPNSDKPYYREFPFITLRDMVKAQILLRKHLGINRIRLGLGGSMGGSQLLEWALMEPEIFDNLGLIATNAKESPWAIALHTAQRMAIEADQSWGEDHEHAGIEGLKAARAIGIPSYRNYNTFEQTQSDSEDKLDNFRASTYQYYQGQKLANRFNAFSYYTMLKALDTHNIGRGRNGVVNAINSIQIPTLLISIDSDNLYPEPEQITLATHLSQVTHHTIHSLYGHDGFLIETETIGPLVLKFLEHNKAFQR